MAYKNYNIILQKLISFKTNGDIRGSKILACGFFYVVYCYNYYKLHKRSKRYH